MVRRKKIKEKLWRFNCSYKSCSVSDYFSKGIYDVNRPFDFINEFMCVVILLC